MRKDRSVGDDSRAVSEVIGYILIFALIFATVGLVSVAALPTLDSARETQQLQNSERAFDVLNSNIIEVYDRGAPSRATELSAEDGAVETGRDVTFNVTAEDKTTGPVIINPIVLTGLGETEFAYEAGAVIRDNQGDGFMIREPPLQMSNDSVFLPLVATQSSSRIATGGGTVLVRTESNGRSVELSTQSQQINITVSNSTNQAVWRTYFEEEQNMSCTTDGATLDCGRSFPDGAQTVVTIQRIAVTLEV